MEILETPVPLEKTETPVTNKNDIPATESEIKKEEDTEVYFLFFLNVLFSGRTCCGNRVCWRNASFG